MNVRLLEPAEQELDEAVAYYNAQADGLGDAFLLETLRIFGLVKQYPLAWHPLGGGIRRCRLSRFPYGVIYTPEADEILVIALAHMHRRPGYWRDRLTAKP
jgi:toxin ParE2